MNAPRPYWSSTDFPYLCLRDRARTEALGGAVGAAVRPGDIVIDAGAGSGILSLFAARAGAGRVYAVEQDPVLVRLLRETVRRNDLGAVIEVVAGDVHSTTLPPADVVVMEMLETGLVEEAQVSAYNVLVSTGVIGAGTRCVPAGYTTIGQPVACDDRFYGFRIATLRHDWSFYDDDPGRWVPSSVTPAGPVRTLWTGHFDGDPLDPRVVARVPVHPSAVATGIRLTGLIQLAGGDELTDFASLNGPKVVPLPDRPAGADELYVRYEMSAGFDHFEAGWAPPVSADRGYDRSDAGVSQFAGAQHQSATAVEAPGGRR